MWSIRFYCHPVRYPAVQAGERGGPGPGKTQRDRSKVHLLNLLYYLDSLFSLLRTFTFSCSFLGISTFCLCNLLSSCILLSLLRLFMLMIFPFSFLEFSLFVCFTFFSALFFCCFCAYSFL